MPLTAQARSALGDTKVLARASAKVTVPEEANSRVRRHLSVAAFLCLLVFVVSFIAMNYAPLPSSGSMRVANMLAAFNIAVSALVMVIAQWRKIGVRRLVDLALVYQVVQGLGISLAEIFATYDPFATVRGVSWVCVWIIGFQLVVPATPGKTFLAAVATATMGPIALLIAMVSGIPDISFLPAVYMVMPNYIAAGVAFILANTLYTLREHVSRAKQMGSYHMVEQLGVGGMGEVWRAEHQMMARPAAIKLIRPDALAGRSDADVATIYRRFQREAEATAKLTSPHTVQVFDFGMTAEGTLYYVMELLEGTDLESLVHDHGPLPAERVVHLLRQACDSLAEAHDRGLIHRDIKPANIYACKLGQSHDQVKILDFGLVAQRSLSGANATKLTADGALTGTPAYMAPEVVSSTAEVDQRVDIYAMGCVAYWLLTGELVFDGETPLQMVFGHVEKEPVPPSKRTALPIPADLEDLILECLSKDPARRPMDAGELGLRLAAIKIGPWTERDAAKWWESTSRTRLAS